MRILEVRMGFRASHTVTITNWKSLTLESLAKSANPCLVNPCLMKGKEPMMGREGGPGFSWWKLFDLKTLSRSFGFQTISSLDSILELASLVHTDHLFHQLSSTEAWRKASLLFLVLDEQQQQKQTRQKQQCNHHTSLTIWKSKLLWSLTILLSHSLWSGLGSRRGPDRLGLFVCTFICVYL